MPCLVFQLLPRLVPQTRGCPQDKNVSQTPQGFDVPTLTLGLARGVKGNQGPIRSPFIHVLTTPARDRSKVKVSPSHSK